MLRKLKIVIAGRRPPPIGGVTVHVMRLFAEVKRKYPHADVHLLSGWSDLRLLIRCDIIHVHFNDQLKRFLFVAICKLLRSTVIVTNHQDYHRDKGVNWLCTLAAIKISDHWIALNSESLAYFERFGKNISMEPSFLPPDEKELQSLHKIDMCAIEQARSHYSCIVASSTYALKFFEDKEIYGIFDIVAYAEELEDCFFIISDPSGSYQAYYQEKGIILPENIMLVSYPHSFIRVLEKSDVLLRNTSTDGDSISIREALFYKKTVLATDVVSRPEGVICYSGKQWISILKDRTCQFVDQIDKSETFDCRRVYDRYLRS